MPNTSATGGYILSTQNPIDSLDLRRFIGTVIVGLSGYDQTLVRPAWQPNPPPIPSIDVDWMAFGMTSRRADNDPYLVEAAVGGTAFQFRHEELDYILTFYGPNCIGRASEFRDATSIVQNQEGLYLSGMAIVNMSDITHAPELINDRWFDRCDMTMTIRREIRRDYRILSFVAANGVVTANRVNEAVSINWSA